VNQWILVAIIVACNAVADLLHTVGMRHHGEVTGLRPKGVLTLFHSLFRNKYVLQPFHGGLFLRSGVTALDRPFQLRCTCHGG
jgi:hypothetical protein